MGEMKTILMSGLCILEELSFSVKSAILRKYHLCKNKVNLFYVSIISDSGLTREILKETACEGVRDTKRA